MAPFSHPRSAQLRGAAATALVCESLEARTLLSAAVTQEIHDAALDVNSSTVLDLFPFVNDTAIPTKVHYNTSAGSFDVQMFDAQAPRTVANFVHYVQTGRYNSTVIHRSIPGFIVQGGGYALPDLTKVSADRRVANEFNVSNTRGTIAMAKFGSQPNSATSEFFINTADNSANLNGQNGGFTAFGQVLGNGMQVIDAINALATTTLTSPFPPLEDFPVTQNPPSGTSSFVRVNSVSLVPELTVVATSDDPSIVAASVSGSNLTLSSGGVSGTAHITINATDTNGAAVAQTFAVTVGVTDVLIGAGGAKVVSYRDADGTTGTVTIKGGSATVHFAGEGLTQNTSAKGVNVTGSGIRIAGITTTGTNAQSALAIIAKGGDGVLEVDNITTSAPLKSVAAKRVVVNGDFVAADPIARIDLNGITNGTLDIGAATATTPVTLNLGAAQDADVVSDVVIKALTATGWTDTDNTVEQISAPQISKLVVKNDMSAALNLSREAGGNLLGSAKIGGALTSGTWRIVGDAGKLSAGSAAAAWAANVSGNVGSFAFNHDLAGNITAASIASMKVGGAMTGTNLTLTEALSGTTKSLAKLSVKGAATNVQVRSTNNLGALSFGGLAGSTVYAGVNTEGGALPTALTDFADAAIAGLTVKGGGGATFANSDVAAKTLGKLNLGTVQTTNSAVPFGVAADKIATLTARDASHRAFKLKNLDDPTDAATKIAALGVPLVDFVIRVF